MFHDLLSLYITQCKNNNIHPDIIKRNDSILRDFWYRFRDEYMIAKRADILSALGNIDNTLKRIDDRQEKSAKLIEEKYTDNKGESSGEKKQ